MKSKRYKNLPEKTFELKPETIDKLLPDIKKIVLQSLMSL